MKKMTVAYACWLSCLVWSTSFANQYYVDRLCDDPQYNCIKIKKGQSWQQFLPDDLQREIVQRLNRTNTYLWRGRKVALPKNLKELTVLDVAPFDNEMDTNNEKVILVDQEKLAWAAYGEDGKIVKWGPISSGKNYCKDVGRNCYTKPGIFYVFSKKDERCRSRSFPVGRGGSRMPYCMFFYRGYALHGSAYMTGRRDSHGCVRMFTEDARWLNEEFVSLTDVNSDIKGTKVIIEDVVNKGNKKNARS